MKSENAGSGKAGSSQPKATGRERMPARIPVMMSQIPMEWMDPMSWRLPSGKALAEFALQSGFLAPLLIAPPRLKKKKLAAPAPVVAVIEKGVKEAPELSGTFRERQF